MRFTLTWGAAALVGILWLGASPVSAQEAELERRVRAYLAPYVEMNHFAGTVLVARGEEILAHLALGSADRGFDVPFSTTTRLRVGSITKDFTAALVSQLEEAGRMSLGDPLARFLPDFPRAERITVEHLLSHTHGVPDWRAHRLHLPTDYATIVFFDDDAEGLDRAVYDGGFGTDCVRAGSW